MPGTNLGFLVLLEAGRFIFVSWSTIFLSNLVATVEARNFSFDLTPQVVYSPIAFLVGAVVLALQLVQFLMSIKNIDICIPA